MGSLPRVYFSVVLLLVNWPGPGEPDTVFGSPVFRHSASGCLVSMTGSVDTYQRSTTTFGDRGIGLKSQLYHLPAEWSWVCSLCSRWTTCLWRSDLTALTTEEGWDCRKHRALEVSAEYLECSGCLLKSSLIYITTLSACWFPDSFFPHAVWYWVGICLKVTSVFGCCSAPRDHRGQGCLSTASLGWASSHRLHDSDSIPTLTDGWASWIKHLC